LTGIGALDGLIGFGMGAGSSLFSSRAGLFLRILAASLAYVVIAAALRRWFAPGGRAWGQVAASIVLLASLTTPLLAAIMVVYAAVFYAIVEHAPTGRARRAAVAGMLLLQVVGPIFWLPALPGYVPIARELIAFATNMTQLRAWAYAYDRLHLHDPERMSPRDYALYTFFFPAFVNGPLVSPREFLERRLPDYWGEEPGPGLLATLRAERYALVRVALGLATASVALHVVPVLQPEAYTAAASGGPVRAWQHTIGVYLAFFLGFTAWTEAAIGCGRLAGMAFPENFDAPHFSYGMADFWRRWNITLGQWMRKYVYVPLGGAHPRGWETRVAWFNVAAVFGATALYHHIGGLKLLGPTVLSMPGYYVPWLLWAAFSTIGTLATRRLRRPARWRLRHTLLVAFTFLFSAIGWLTALFPVGMPLARLAEIYRQLVGLG
jgi:D-alanyl-lipoteichoic acid acyltransferase DltB (MBOAT superfamily)